MASFESKFLKQIDGFLETKFDFLIVGGGTAGLVLAARLSENPSWNVGVLEAGKYLVDTMIRDASVFMEPRENPAYTWQISSVPQKNLANRAVSLPIGRVLGGSTSINHMLYMRGSKLDYDSWESIGNPGWGWEGLLPYFKKAEGIVSSDQPLSSSNDFSEAKVLATSSDPSRYDGSGGFIRTTYDADTVCIDLEKGAPKAYEAQGIRSNATPESGDATGFFYFRRSVYPGTNERCSSLDGYIKTIDSRPNLHILTEALVTRLLFDGDSGSKLVATGAEFMFKDTKCTVTADKEIILSAGALKTPQILELSGIGDKKILTSHNIPVILDYPMVGENLMDHLGIFLIAKLKDPTLAKIKRPAPGAGFCPLPSFIPQAKLDQMRQALDDHFSTRQLTPFGKVQYEAQKKLINANVGMGELIFGGYHPTLLLGCVVMHPSFQHPFSRGSVHIQSNDPHLNPEVDPRYLDVPFDQEVMKEVLKASHRILRSSPLSEYLTEDYALPPNYESFEEKDFDKYIAENLFTNFHQVGTAVMAPRELGGVVDPSLKVYGTQNLRVVDGSIFPHHISVHTQATVYAIAEKAADMIRNYYC